MRFHCPCCNDLRIFVLFGNGLPTIGKIGVTEFFLGETWRPNNDLYGILPMILGSAYVTLGAIVVGVPIGILTAVFMARFCPDSIYRFLKPAVEWPVFLPLFMASSAWW